MSQQEVASSIRNLTQGKGPHYFKSNNITPINRAHLDVQYYRRNTYMTGDNIIVPNAPMPAPPPPYIPHEMQNLKRKKEK